MQEPLITKDLLEYLERIYPDKCPEPATPEREIWIAVGRATLVRHLRRLFIKQTATVVAED
jgi:hypothetical protein